MITAAAIAGCPLSSGNIGDLFWLIGWCVFFICVAAIVCTAIIKL